MTAKPRDEGTGEQPRDDEARIEGEQPDADATAEQDADVEVTGGPWEPAWSPEQMERFANAIQPHLLGLKRFEDQVRNALSNMAATLIDLNQLTQPLLSNLSCIAPNLVGLGELLTEKMPPNWPRPTDFDLVFQVIQDEGIPLVWVPRADIVADLLTAPDRDTRIKVLTARSSDVAQDCREVLDQIARPDLVHLLPMAVSALDAYVDGHHAPAQALSVVVVETVVTRTIGSYRQAKTFAKIDEPRDLDIAELRFRAALAPIGPFYLAWRPSSGDPMPEHLSRHVTVHQADPAHYTHGNATVAIMLLASVLRGVEEYLDLTTPATSQPAAAAAPR
ncbi:hypothetical protein [Micromonospora inositola]|uniref:Uncharacterized protein n=1 Tax=Micromonospora inositola TaxID=47865 RepID=A0A1C5JMQ8_9ACTN|nr:hypothetical protein [Micromonospora inositola]SCG71798.1 hypothetical protein GA0070613_4975 [Micromonospora inositola]